MTRMKIALVQQAAAGNRPRGERGAVTCCRAGRRIAYALLILPLVAACGDLNVVTESYATLAEATADGAVGRGDVPPGLPPGARELRVAYDTKSPRRWGLFDFPPAEADALRALLGPELSLRGVEVDPPRRIEWWPVLLRGPLDDEQVRATGARAYTGRAGELIFVVNWKQGRAFYWAGQQ